MDADQFGHGHAPTDAGHHVHRVRAADADRDHAHPAGVGGMRVGADHHAAGESVVLEDDLMDDPRSGLPETGAVTGGGAAQELVDFFILRDRDFEVRVSADAGLDQVVAVHGRRHDDALQAGELELQQRHLCGCVLQGDAVWLQHRVVDAPFDWLVGRIGEMAEEDLLGQRQRSIESLAGDRDAVTQLGVSVIDARQGVGFISHGRIQFGALGSGVAGLASRRSQRNIAVLFWR